jgi:hypothetical protein
MFTGTRPDRLVVRIGEIRSTKKTASCSFQLESPTERFKPKVSGKLEFATVPTGDRTKVVLQGMADRDLVGPLAPTETVRGVANEYVRQLLDEIAKRLEQLATSEPATAKATYLKVHAIGPKRPDRAQSPRRAFHATARPRPG